jgi:hypothetical protein
MALRASHAQLAGNDNHVITDLFFFCNKFGNGEKKSFKIGKDHMKLTQMLKDNGFDGKKGPMASCYMCHRGKLVPEYKEPQSAKSH